MQQEIKENLALVEKSLTPFIAEIQSLTVTNEETKVNAVTFLGEIKKRHKAVDERRKQRVEPLNAEVKEINNSYKVWLEKLEKAARILNDSLIQYHDEQERKARIEAERLRKEQEEKERIEAERIAALKAEEERLRKEAEAAKDEEEKARLKWEADNKQDEAVKAEDALAVIDVPVVAEPEKTVRTGSGVFSVKKVWKWEVENEATLRKAHPELFILDEKAVNKLVQNGEREIAGLKVFQVSQGATRA